MNQTPPASSSSQFPTFQRVFRWLIRPRTRQVALFAGACLATLIGLFYAVENWRGRRAWERFRKQWEAKGERFEAASFIPKPMPAEQNFAMTPFLAGLLDYEPDPVAGVRWRDTNVFAKTAVVSLPFRTHRGRAKPSFGSIARTEFIDLSGWAELLRGDTNFLVPGPGTPPAQAVLAALSKLEPVLNELRTASRRPHAVFPVHYQENYRALLPHLARLKAITQVLCLRTAALLETAQPDLALADVELGLHLAEALRPEPLLISQLVRNAILQITLTSVWQGLAKGQWPPAHLEQLQKRFAATGVLAQYGLALRGERAFANDLLEQMRRGQGLTPEQLGSPHGQAAPPRALVMLFRLMPDGWLYQNQLVLNRLYQERGLPLVDAPNHRVVVTQGVLAEETSPFDRGDSTAEAPELARPTPFNFVARLLAPALPPAARKFAHAQTMLDCAVVACAAERYRLANGVYPNQLGELTPRFLDRVPPDVIDGAPLKYRRTADGAFVLYSVGWNQQDDGGTTALTKNGEGVALAAGDWVWRYPR